jgi:hypothetical protein
MSDSSPHQRQRHGVKKKLVEGIGGVLIGAALVVLVRGFLRGRVAKPNATSQTTQNASLDSGETT